MFWDHFFHGSLFLLQVFCCGQGGGLSSSLHVEANFLEIGSLSCLGGDRVRREESPFFIHGELAGEVAVEEIDGRVPPVNVWVVTLMCMVCISCTFTTFC